MDPERWKRVSELFADCVELPLSDREKFLRSQGKEFDDVFIEVSRLLAEHESAGSFLGLTAAGLATDGNSAVPTRVFEDGDVLGADFESSVFWAGAEWAKFTKHSTRSYRIGSP